MTNSKLAGWRRMAAVMGLLWACAIAPAQDLELDLRLREAVPHIVADKPSLNHGHTLIVPLRRIGDRWERFVAYAGAGPRTVHGGRVSEAKAAADGIALALDMEVAGDYGRVAPGRASFQVELKRQPDGSYRGTHEGTWHGRSVKGMAEATVVPRRKTVSNHVPVQSGEHPRILFRKADLPALREKAKTPFGQAALAKMAGPAMSIALAYDWGYGGWTPEQRQAVRQRALAHLKQMPTRDRIAQEYGFNKGGVHGGSEVLLMLALGEEGNLKARYDHLKKYLIKHVETCYDAWGVSQEGPGYSEYPGSFLVPAALSMKQLGDDGVKISGGKEAGRPMFLLQGRNEGYVKGWVLHPADAEVETKGDPLRINVKGGDADIWVVMLVGEGKPAEASITGTGIDSRLTVGTSTITIDNAKGRIVHGSQK